MYNCVFRVVRTQKLTQASGAATTHGMRFWSQLLTC